MIPLFLQRCKELWVEGYRWFISCGSLGIGFFEDLDLFLFEVFGEEGGETGFGVGCKVFADGTVAVEDCEEGVVGDVGEWMDGAVGILIGFVRVCG